MSIIGSASIWDSDLDLSSNQVASSNLALSPLDPSASLFEPAQSDGNLDIFSIDSSDPLFENVEKNTFIPGEIGFEGLDLTSADGALTLDSSFDVADCSTSILFPAIGKSRIKRAAANSEKCKNPTSGAINNPPLGGDEQGPTGPDVTDEEVDEFFQNPAIRRLWFKAEDTENQNPSCHMISLGALPYGVCSSGSVADQSSVVENVVEIVGAGSFRGLTLAHCTLCKLGFFSFVFFFLFFPVVFSLVHRTRKGRGREEYKFPFSKKKKGQKKEEKKN